MIFLQLWWWHFADEYLDFKFANKLQTLRVEENNSAWLADIQFCCTFLKCVCVPIKHTAWDYKINIRTFDWSVIFWNLDQINRNSHMINEAIFVVLRQHKNLKLLNWFTVGIIYCLFWFSDLRWWFICVNHSLSNFRVPVSTFKDVMVGMQDKSWPFAYSWINYNKSDISFVWIRNQYKPKYG